MGEFGIVDAPLIDIVLHPTDLSAASAAAFHHALAVALQAQSELVILHVDDGDGGADPCTELPGVRTTLESWGLLEEGSPRMAVEEELAVRVSKVAMHGSRPLNSILKFLDRKPADLIVLATRGLDGMPRWLQGSIAEPLARRSQTMTLFVPEGSRGFVDAKSGRVDLRRILVPADHEPSPRAAVEFATRAAAGMADEQVEITVLHVGEEMPELRLPADPAWRWSTLLRRGDAVDRMVECAEEVSADLIVMTTDGPDGILDVLRGSHSERLLRRTGCPLLAVPQAWVESKASWLAR